MSKQSKHNTDVHSISDARESHSDEMRTRMIRYTVSMSIRLVCFILVFVVPYGWLSWVMIAGAVFLPYFAVIVANGGSDTSNIRHSDALIDRAPVREIEARVADADPADPEDDILSGEIIDDTPPTAHHGSWAAGSGRPGANA
ncbi:DUF3099 domain-containing protein [Arthrobacter agilis]|uniref:DUF3099 domain-containing protein n=2 Tax=Arthrobacter agilis TaxID=37921 RepID=UPI000B35A2C3|nr:DUF3099 domain-containing protein [Arthrobacter agilis]OUM44509.1 hypothetical protein B8W74_03350 [Arthrobacter agilis]PPB47414.1 DUF3099 domain-containing protein [Arthrobacter agilis]TPV22794.1 DUF3099 domain-containing protein [Arthrobacter agilis]VDR32044.1 Protein of uncharacterised function (DUF3099) [Arthrobacter agilis]